MDDNEAIFKRIFDDEEFQQVLKDWYAARVYQRARADPRVRSARLDLNNDTAQSPMPTAER